MSKAMEVEPYPDAFWPHLKGKPVDFVKKAIETDTSYGVHFKTEVFYPGCEKRNVHSFMPNLVRLFTDKEGGLVMNVPENG